MAPFCSQGLYFCDHDTWYSQHVWTLHLESWYWVELNWVMDSMIAWAICDTSPLHETVDTL